MTTNNQLHFTGIIPARYASSRLPGKPLLLIGGKPMIQLVYEQARKSLDTVYVATDDERIFNAVHSFGGKAVMTSPLHQSGTDRCAEAANKIAEETGTEIDVVINIQGDEPFVRPEQTDLLISCFADPSVEIATLVKKVEPGEDILDPNQPKVIIDSLGNAIYFSRAAIPYIRDSGMSDWTYKHIYYKHPGLYGYKMATLNTITRLPTSPLEAAESLEQNRWLENGFKIRTGITIWDSISIDTPEDLERARIFFDQFK